MVASAKSWIRPWKKSVRIYKSHNHSIEKFHSADPGSKNQIPMGPFLEATVVYIQDRGFNSFSDNR